MFNTPPRPWQILLLGHDRRQQIPIAMTLCAMAVYAICIGAEWFWVYTGHVSAARANALMAVTIVGQALIYAALRSGWSQRFEDPALTLPQMVFALLCLGVAYHFNPLVRGVLLMIVALVLMFGAFTLSPPRCRLLGWLAVVIFDAVMLFGSLTDPAIFQPVVEMVTFVFATATLPLIAHLSGRLSKLRHDLHVQKRELRDALERVNRLATRDELTGLPNRRGMLDWAAREIPRLRRHESPLCIAVLDLDHFKAVNDRFGHAVGDQALVNFARQAQTVLREADTLARWGGEEFLLALPDTPPGLARLVLQRVHERLRQPQHWLSCPEALVTFSAGLAAHQPGESFEQTVARADLALYAAKHQGRDRSVEAPAPLPADPGTGVSPLRAVEANPIS